MTQVSILVVLVFFQEKKNIKKKQYTSKNTSLLRRILCKIKLTILRHCNLRKTSYYLFWVKSNEKQIAWNQTGIIFLFSKTGYVSVQVLKIQDRRLIYAILRESDWITSIQPSQAKDRHEKEKEIS